MVSFLHKFMAFFIFIEVMHIFLMLDFDYNDLFYRLFKEEWDSIARITGLEGLNDSIFDKCILYSNPTWTNEMRKLLNPLYDPLKNCDRTYRPWSTLNADGRVSIRSQFSNADCSARAILYKDDYTNVHGDWHRVEEKFVFEARKDVPVIPEQSSKEKPSVYIIVMDSFGASHAKRVFPKTLNFLINELEAVEMHHLNKVGENSRPNAFPFLFGKTVQDIYRDIWGLSNIESDLNYSQLCYQYLDDEPFITKDFEKHGYRTMMVEDWSLGIFNWPECKGFKKPPASHYMRPFQLEMANSARKFHAHQGKANCYEHYHFMNDYLEQFMNAYSDMPKFALYWDTSLGHDYSNEPFHADRDFLEFFEKNKDKLDDSFLFFMADHGLRFGKMSDTPEGRRDVSNPMLYIAVPRRLRNNSRLTQNLKANSNELLTMFDVHATLLDIVESFSGSEQPDFKETVQKERLRRIAVITKNHDQGTSLLRPLPPGVRNCKTLPIPFEYCICHLEMQAVPITNEFTRIDQVIADSINSQLRKFNVHENCAQLVTELKLVMGTKDLYQATVRLKPSGGLYKTFVRGSAGFFKVVAPDITRLDSYGSEGNCIDVNEIRPLCYCRGSHIRSFINGFL